MTSWKMNLHGLPALVYGEVLTADTLSMTRRTPGNAPSTLAFPKSKSSLWDPSPSGDAVGLQLCYYRCPHLRVLEKALRLAHRHAHQRSNPALCCFLLGSISVDEDEEGVTLSLDRFDPGREQGGVRVPSLLLPGDVVVPLEFILQGDMEPSPSDLSLAFQAMQQAFGGAEVADLSQLLGVRGQVSCSQQGDQLGFSLHWLAASCAGGFDVVGVRPLPIIPTALARSLSGLSGLSRPGLKQQRGFLTMDQTRKLLLLLESDPKACSLPLVGVWLSGVVQPSNPLVWAWCLRFSHSSSLQERVLSEQGWFLLVLFSSSQPRFFQVRSADSGSMAVLHLSCSQDLTLFKHVEPAEGHYLQADLCLDETRQTELVQGPAAGPLSSLLGATVDQDSGVEDEDLSPRPSPSPHAATQQTRRVQPSVPELSLLVDASLPPSALPPTPLPSSLHPLGRPYLHSTPAAPLSRATAGFWTVQTPPTLILPHPECGSTPPGSGPPSRPSPQLHPGALQTGPPLPCSCLQAGRPLWEEGGAVPSDAYQILMAQERQLRLLQAQIQMLLEPQALSGQPDGPLVVRPEEGPPSSPQTLPPTTASVAVETGASLFWRSSPPPRDQTRGDRPSSPLRDCTLLHCTSRAESPVPGTSSSMFFNTIATQPDHVLPTLQLQVSSRLQASLIDQETPPSSPSSSLPYGDHAHSYRKQEIQARSYRKQEISEGDEEQLGVTLDLRPALNTEDGSPDHINPALLPSLARTPRDPPSLARTPRDPPSLARTPRDPPSLARTPRDSLLPGGSVDLSLAPLLPGGSVDLSLEANAIALRYLSDGQLSRLSVGGQGSRAALGPPDRSTLSPSNMSLATRGYMRRYGLIEEEEEEEEEEQRDGLSCSTLGTGSSLPQSQLIQDLQPQLHLLARSSRTQNQDQDQVAVRQRASMPAGSVGNFLDVGRLRQLPKLF